MLHVSYIEDPAHACQRECDDGPARRCVYDFHVEYFFTMSKACYDCPHSIEDCDRHHCISADGVERGVVVVNRQLPGPSIQVNSRRIPESKSFFFKELLNNLWFYRFVKVIGL